MSSTSSSSPPPPQVLVAPSKKDVALTLNDTIVHLSQQSIQEYGRFTIALSGGSLPEFLSTLPQAFDVMNIDPQWHLWYILLADERCVPVDHDDSNMKAIQNEFLQFTSIPSSQVYGLDPTLLHEFVSLSSSSSTSTSTEHFMDAMDAIAKDYEMKLRQVLYIENTQHQQPTDKRQQLDLAVLGFGPDGHTCSLFPHHELLKEQHRWVVPIMDSPKPPPHRITLTLLPMLNSNTRHIIVCGAGESKTHVITSVFAEEKKKIKKESLSETTPPAAQLYEVSMVSPPTLPCAMVQPLESLTWIIDNDAMGIKTDE